MLFLVYPKDGTDPVNKLVLADGDLRGMDADRVRKTVWAKLPYWTETTQYKVDKAAGGVYHYRN